jgi:hypothetical protein
LFVVVLVMAPSSQELEPPANPGRFIFVVYEVLQALEDALLRNLQNLHFLFTEVPHYHRPEVLRVPAALTADVGINGRQGCVFIEAGRYYQLICLICNRVAWVSKAS